MEPFRDGAIDRARSTLKNITISVCYVVQLGGLEPPTSCSTDTRSKAKIVCNIAPVHWKRHETCCCQAAIHLKERCHPFLRGLAAQKQHVVLDMLKVVGGHSQEASSHRGVGFGA